MRTAAIWITGLLAIGPVAAAELPLRPGFSYCGDGIDVSRQGVGGEDVFCTPLDEPTPTGGVVLICEHQDIGTGPPFLEAATIIENLVDGTLLYVSETDRVVLEYCDPREP